MMITLMKNGGMDMERPESKILSRCSVCGEAVEKIIQYPHLDGSRKTKPIQVHCTCKCERDAYLQKEKKRQFEEEQRRIDMLRNLSLIDVKFRNARLSTFKVTDENRRLYNIAERYVQHFDEMYEKNRGILFWGPVGTGKSYTAAVIANELLDRKISVVMTSFINMLRGNLNSDDVVDRINNARLLIIDDLGAERNTDYALEKVYDIIDSRYRIGKPIILTTNLEMSQMKSCEDIRYGRIYDRIFEMCYPVAVKGASMRKKDAAEKYMETKTLLEGT